jgi:hypothetical protein
MSGQVGYRDTITNGLILNLDAANYKSYPGTGTTWTDLSQYKSNGTLTNGPTFSSTNGGGITFDGVDDYVIGNSSLSAITTDMTMIIFAKIPNFLNRVPLFTKYQSSAPQGFVLEVGTGSTLWTKTMRFFAANNGTVSSVDYRGTAQLIDNNIYMFTVQYKTATSIKMYYNLTEMPATQAGGSLASVLNWNSGTNPYYVGAYSPSVSVYGNSTVYTTMLYNRILSFDELSQNYNALKGRFGL